MHGPRKWARVIRNSVQFSVMWKWPGVKLRQAARGALAAVEGVAGAANEGNRGTRSAGESRRRVMGRGGATARMARTALRPPAVYLPKESG